MLQTKYNIHTAQQVVDVGDNIQEPWRRQRVTRCGSKKRNLHRCFRKVVDWVVTWMKGETIFVTEIGSDLRAKKNIWLWFRGPKKWVLDDFPLVFCFDNFQVASGGRVASARWLFICLGTRTGGELLVRPWISLNLRDFTAFAACQVRVAVLLFLLFIRWLAGWLLSPSVRCGSRGLSLME